MKELNINILSKILGLKNPKKVSDGIMFSCPFARYKRPDGSRYHKNGTDRKPSFGISTDSPSLYNCFSCGCKGLLTSLPTNLSYASGKDYPEARDFILKNDIAEFDDYDSVMNRPQVMPALSEDIIKKLSDIPVKIALSLGLSDKIINNFELRYYQKDERIIMPIRDNFGRLVSLKGRYVGSDKYILEKYKFLTYKGKEIKKLGGVWLGMDKPLIKDKPIIITESESDSWHLFNTDLVNNIWCSMGANVTDNQIFNLQQVYNPIVFFLDNDKAGINTTNKLINKLKNLTKLFKVTNYYGEKDISDLVKNGKIIRALNSIKEI